jgi:hypothetical protein
VRTTLCWLIFANLSFYQTFSNFSNDQPLQHGTDRRTST